LARCGVANSDNWHLDPPHLFILRDPAEEDVRREQESSRRRCLERGTGNGIEGKEWRGELGEKEEEDREV
jgi:hypothetical protein